MLNSVFKNNFSDLSFTKKVHTVFPETNLLDALTMLKDNNIGALVVINQQNLVQGIFTERDYIQKIALNQNLDLASESISKYMVPSPKCVSCDTKLNLGLGLMRIGKFRHLIVTDKENKLTGIVSMKDAFDYFCDQV
ncbi:MAG: CBS domain-containing protein [Halobacteriovoraceae bacterium]|jgi:CBS domain-containing protein|nr:CBS domain-containing protein [Halobacteriovoraceae bacterium]MBT5095749.1 CBS domain-containing protein [Halobacteriovoraceae bacterium]